MGEVPLSFHVTAETKRELEEHARQLNVSVAEIAERAIASYLEIPARERAILKERLAEADKGVFISSEAMMRWMESWDTDEELPPPEPDVFLPPRRR
jgi:predicted transcriptional regulator